MHNMFRTCASMILNFHENAMHFLYVGPDGNHHAFLAENSYLSRQIVI